MLPEICPNETNNDPYIYAMVAYFILITAKVNMQQRQGVAQLQAASMANIHADKQLEHGPAVT